MKNGIQDEKYYFLLDWKDKHMDKYIAIKGERRLCDLTPYELNKLYQGLKAEEKHKSKYYGNI